jgi:flagellar biosynthesis/type III secretory pathway protein FliH
MSSNELWDRFFEQKVKQAAESACGITKEAEDLAREAFEEAYQIGYERGSEDTILSERG